LSQPLTQTAAGPAIARYATPKRPPSLVVLTLAATLVVLAAFVLSQLFGSTKSDSDPSDPVPSTDPSRSGGLPFEHGSTAGYWSLRSPRWDSGRGLVTIEVEISVDQGLLAYQFYAYATHDADATILYPVSGGPNSLDSGYVRAGQSLVGDLVFATTRQDLTLILAGESFQISALPVPG
jgi:hypothetical protein